MRRGRVTGETAARWTSSDRSRERHAVVFAFVLALAFLLLLVSFRSLVVAVTADRAQPARRSPRPTACSSWSSSTASARALLGLQATGAIVAWMPLFLFVILFGLSMDYHVFIVSRIREGHDRGLRTRDAIAAGITSTAGVVTSAAVIMVASSPSS